MASSCKLTVGLCAGRIADEAEDKRSDYIPEGRDVSDNKICSV